jgi:hypothetical protein
LCIDVINIEVDVEDVFSPKIMPLSAHFGLDSLVVHHGLTPNAYSVDSERCLFAIPRVDLPELESDAKFVMGWQVLEDLRDGGSLAEHTETTKQLNSSTVATNGFFGGSQDIPSVSSLHIVGDPRLRDQFGR